MTTTRDSAGPWEEFEVEQRVAALLEPDHEQAQFELLWARIAAAPLPRAAYPPVARRWSVSWTALAATLLFGASVAWYHGATAPDYTTLGDSPRHRCDSTHVPVKPATASSPPAATATRDPGAPPAPSHIGCL